ncbi:MAG: histidine phosphatase family protein [Chromatiales bacterium]|jgi:phosphohistidine phosphatase SixA
MKSNARKPWVELWLSMFCLIASLQPVAAEQGQLGSEQLIDALQQGGLVIYFRHAATDHSQDDQHPVDLSDCTTQRNLSPVGRQQAQLIGEAIGRLNISIDEVISSPFCRCRDTAQLMFGRYHPDVNLYYAIAVDKVTRALQSEHLRNLLSTPPRAGMVRVIVAHTGNLREATGIWPKPEGAAWVFRPLGDGRYEALGMLEPDNWPTAD